MPYIAHSAVIFTYDENPQEKNKWHVIKKKGKIEYRWKLSSDRKYEIIAGVFDNPQKALECAKQLYVTLFYYVLKHNFQVSSAGCQSYAPRIMDYKEIIIDGYHGDERFFFWDKNHRGGNIGPGVFKVENSLDEFDEYSFLSGELIPVRNSDLNNEGVDEYLFSYCKEAQELFDTILLAENAYEYGIKMTIYCGLLEHLSENIYKDKDILDVIDELQRFVNKSSLDRYKKESLHHFLESGRWMSSRQKCFRLCEKYANESYGGYTCKKIIQEAYGLRSSFSHGEHCEVWKAKCAGYIKLVVLDVIMNYMREKESIV